MFSLHISPDRFIASNGKLDSNNLHIFRSNTDDFDFIFTTSPTMKITLNPLGFVQDVAGHHVYSQSDDSSFTSSFIKMRYR